MKKIIKMAMIAAVAVIGATATTVVATKSGDLAKVFAGIQQNAYGCEGECTAEYYPSHLNSIIAASPEVEHTENVRVICKVTSLNGFYYDINMSQKYINSSDGNFKTDLRNGLVIQTFGTKKGLTFTQGDIIAFYGKLEFNEVTIPGSTKTRVYAEINNPVVYKVNDTVNLDLLVDPVYLQ